jgi:peptide/nickel transport system permease protein
MGLQVGYLMGGSILVVFSWPGTGLLLNTAIFQRDLPLLQGTIWVLALFLCCSICWWIFCKPPSTRELRGADHGGYRNDESGRLSGHASRQGYWRGVFRRLLRDPAA